MRVALAGLLLSFAAVPLTARADTTDLFTLIGDGHTYTWTLPTTETFNYPAVPIFVPGFTPLSETIDGASVTPSGIIFYPAGRQQSIMGIFGTLYGPSVLDILSETGPFGNTYPQYDTYTVTFYTGTFPLYSINSSMNNVPPTTPYTLTVAAAAATTPEPSSLLLLSTGLLLSVAFVRRRHLI